jgi:lipid-A-disaccharide synthase
LDVDRDAARDALGVARDANLIALLPGSRMGEVERLGSNFGAAAAWIAARRPETRFIAPMASARARRAFEAALATVPSLPGIQLVDGQPHRVLAAADAAIVASGTATLETLLTNRPMVVAYRFGALTAWLLRRLGLVKVPYFSQPNLLVGRRLVPEFLQEAVTGAALGEALLQELGDRRHLDELQREFRRVHETLRRGGAERAANAIIDYART